MKVLLTGSDGYLGSLAGPYLLDRGHDVTGLDTGFYRSGWLYNRPGRSPAVVHKDIRDIESSDLAGFDAIVHMAELSNDPLGQLNPDLTFEINHRATVRMAEMARAVGVRRFVYMSSCSVYGVAATEWVDEESPINPQTAYAECKALVERDLTPMTADGFTTTFLRNATAFGASPRMRFDIVLNNLSGSAWTTGKIEMISDGSPWRPLVHGLDIAQAIDCILDAPPEVVAGEKINIGSTEQNYQVREIAETVGEVFEGCEVTFGDSSDNRSYRVNFDKIGKLLPTFECRWPAKRGAEQLLDVYRAIDMDDAGFRSRHYTRLDQLQYLLRTNQVDGDLLWQ